jgi:hypothetical protein
MFSDHLQESVRLLKSLAQDVLYIRAARADRGKQQKR